MALPELTTPDSQLKWLSINSLLTNLLPYLSETRLRIEFVASPIVLELPWFEESTPVDKDHEVVSDSP